MKEPLAPPLHTLRPMAAWTAGVLLVCCAALPAAADEAESTAIIPGHVYWCVGHCESTGYSWIDINGESYFTHRNGLDGILAIAVPLTLVLATAALLVHWLRRRAADSLKKSSGEGETSGAGLD